MIISNKIGASPTLVFAQAARKRISEGKDIVSMGLGQPDMETPQFLTDALVKAANSKKCNGYIGAMGLMPLRKSITEDLNSRRKSRFEPSQVIMTNGAKQALQLTLFSLLKPDDEVIYFTPNYVSYLPQMLMAEPNCTPVSVALDANFDIDFELLKSKITAKTKVIVLNSPHNPTGKVLANEAYENIAKISKANNIKIILDDVYELLTYDINSVYDLSLFDDCIENVYFINSFSKSHSIPGWRLGYVIAPPAEVGQMVKIQQHMSTNVNSISQHAALSIFENGHDFLQGYRERLMKRSETVYDSVTAHIKENVFRPMGGFFYFLNISEYVNDSNIFCADMMNEVGVAMTPGIAFGEDWNNYVRLSFGVDEDRLQIGLDRFSSFLHSYKNAND